MGPSRARARGRRCFVHRRDGLAVLLRRTVLFAADEAFAALQDRTDWPKLYDLEKLRTCKTKTACALYLDDMFVDFDLAMDVVNNYMGPNVGANK